MCGKWDYCCCVVVDGCVCVGEEVVGYVYVVGYGLVEVVMVVDVIG